MKKLHEIKIIYISKKKKKSQRENKFSNRRRRRNFVTVWRRCLPRSERIACAFEKPEWTQSRASCPLRGDLPPLQRNTTVPRPDSQFVFTAKANLASVHSSDARLLDTTNIVARFSLCPRFVLFSPLFYRGDGKKGSNQQWSHESTTYDDGKRDRITWILLGIQTTICSIDESPKFPTNENKCQSINSWFLYHQ